mmetsp:Transcript_17424/g.32879  ORF Transcript_17424/g.32879 Transcript_17424/m.32879 type:complete len:228 (+) Transcript_17424:2422-3105(+)
MVRIIILRLRTQTHDAKALWGLIRPKSGAASLRSQICFSPRVEMHYKMSSAALHSDYELTYFTRDGFLVLHRISGSVQSLRLALEESALQRKIHAVSPQNHTVDVHLGKPPRMCSLFHEIFDLRLQAVLTQLNHLISFHDPITELSVIDFAIVVCVDAAQQVLDVMAIEIRVQRLQHAGHLRQADVATAVSIPRCKDLLGLIDLGFPRGNKELPHQVRATEAEQPAR